MRKIRFGSGLGSRLSEIAGGDQFTKAIVSAGKSTSEINHTSSVQIPNDPMPPLVKLINFMPDLEECGEHFNRQREKPAAWRAATRFSARIDHATPGHSERASSHPSQLRQR